MNINITTTTETLQLLEEILGSYEQAIDDHLYRTAPASWICREQDTIATVRAELNRMIGQAERQIMSSRQDLSRVHVTYTHPDSNAFISYD